VISGSAEHRASFGSRNDEERKVEEIQMENLEGKAINT
jgi:hypothetical protein